MIQLTDSVWIGNSTDEAVVDLGAGGIRAILNVAPDLRAARNCSDGLECAQVGVVDGPGNELTDYCAAFLCLKVLVRRHKCVLVCDHNGARALVIALMYLNLIGGEWRTDPLAWSHWPTWEQRLTHTCANFAVPTPHQAHIDAFNAIPWGLLGVI